MTFSDKPTKIVILIWLQNHTYSLGNSQIVIEMRKQEIPQSNAK